jgi:ATP-binding cassette subfamily B (MDR/TAP) protein 1
MDIGPILIVAIPRLSGHGLGFWYAAQLLPAGQYTVKQFYLIFIGVLFAGQAAGAFLLKNKHNKPIGTASYIPWLRALKPVIQENKDNSKDAP